MTINQAVRTDIDNSVLCWLASVDADGMPNVSPKEIFAALEDDRIVIAEIASKQSLANIEAHPNVCVSFVDVFRQRGFKLKGTARLVRPAEPDFQVLAAPLKAMAGPAFPINAVFEISVTKVARIWAPSYALFPERSEEERMEDAYKTYGVTAAR
jgi:uncharacterized protein